MFLLSFRFLYSDIVDLSAENAFHLLYTAQKYQVEVLKAKCVEFLHNNMNADTVAPILDQGVFYNEEKLIRQCLDFLSANPTKNLAKVNDYHVSKETLDIMVDCESIVVDEVCIFNMCNSWAVMECAKKGLDATAENKRDMLGSTLNKIRFCSMGNGEIASMVSESGLLTIKEELDVFRFINGSHKTTAIFPFKKRSVVKILLPPRFNNVSQQNKRYYIAFMSRKSTTSDIFQVRLTCRPMTFKLLGLTFRETGTFQIKINEYETETVCVYDLNVTVYLRRPTMCDLNYGLAIQGSGIKESTLLPLPEPKWQPHTEDIPPDYAVEECSVTGTHSPCDPNVTFNVKKVGNVVVPLAGFIVTL